MVFGRRGSREPRGQTLEAWWLLREEGPGSLGRSRTSAGRGWDRVQVPQCALVNTRGHLDVHEAPAKGIPLPSRGQALRPDQLPQCCGFGLQEAASLPCLVAMATPVPRLLRAGGEKGGGKARGGFSGKAHLLSPQETKLGGETRKE